MKRIPLLLIIFLCLTLGLAPFRPEPHLLGKMRLLLAGELQELIDVFDLLLHASPWVLLLLKLVTREASAKQPGDSA